MSEAIIPIPRMPIAIREATMDDLPFMDRLQKMHSKMVGFMHQKTLEGKINLGQVVVAEDETKQSVGYAIGTDRYFKRDDVGIIYQMNVAPEKQRGLIGAQLVGAMFDRAHVSCRLSCLWCAQDIEANYFWESLGFTPLAFRAGSRAKDRVHIFWEKRIRQGDTTTPWWYPTQTSGGSIGEARLVFPIPPGVKWSDPMPRILPQSGVGILPAQIEDKKRPRGRDAHATKRPVVQCTLGRLQFSRPVEKKEKPARPKREKMKNDPALLAKARKLNACWLEEINSNPSALPAPSGKYRVARALQAPTMQTKPTALLEAA